MRFPDNFAFELSKAQQNIQREPAHGVRRVEMLRDGNERYVVAFEHLDDPGEIHERPAQAINLVHYHTVNPAGFNIGQESLDCRSLDVPAREAAVIVAIR